MSGNEYCLKSAIHTDSSLTCGNAPEPSCFAFSVNGEVSPGFLTLLSLGCWGLEVLDEAAIELLAHVGFVALVIVPY